VEPTRVLVVGDDPLVRSGLAALLASRRDVVVSGLASSEELAATLAERGHDVVAWAPGPKEDAGVERLRAAAAAGVPVVAIVDGSEQAAAALRAEARGLVQRGADGPTLGAALTAAAAGLVVLEPSLADEWLRQPGRATGDEPLTPREREVLALLAEGIGNKAIAARLGISEHTAKFHVNAILAKLGAGSRAEAIVLAARQGLVVL
jgi:DNA-binding NarL/FixJ family response regulator